MLDKRLIFFVLTILVFQNFNQVSVNSEKTDVVNFSVIIDDASNFDALASWLDMLNFSHFTFCIWECAEDSILSNATRISKLKQYGEIIPRLAYVQQLSPTEREAKVDATIVKYNNSLGCTPKGVFDYIPDTYTARYLYSKGIVYYQGYCFDQWIIDYMSMRGGFQMPYYASDTHVLIPSNQRGIIILPHASWDWIASFKYAHSIQLHPLNLIKRVFSGDVNKAKTYFLNMIDNSLAGSFPFGYVCVQFEWDWCYEEGITSYILDWINTTLTTRNYHFWNFNETAEWFISNFASTPTYHINFVSPYKNESIEWYYSTECRIARIGNNIVSYVDYDQQKNDKYLVQSKSINWGYLHRNRIALT